MNDVFIIGAGRVKVEKASGVSLKELGAQAVALAIENAGSPPVEALYLGNMLSGIALHQQQLGLVIAEGAGLAGIEAWCVEAACASGGVALHVGTLAIKSGLYHCVVVCGLEQMSHSTKDEITAALATASDWELEGSRGATFLSLNARLMRAYMEHYGVVHEGFGDFAINAHKNALTNPYALFHKTILSSDYLDAKIIERPLCLYDISPVCDGAAALVLVSRSFLTALPSKYPRVKVKASAMATDTLALSRRPDPHRLKAVRRSSELAYRQASVSPLDIDLFELHDAFSIMASLSLEESGFAELGQGCALARAGEITLTGRIPISTFGGLKARGHPVGATGVYQGVEVFLQLTHQAKENQVPNAAIGMCQNIGGLGGTVVTHILEAV